MIGVTNDLEYAVLLVFFMHKLDGKMRLQLIDVKKGGVDSWRLFGNEKFVFLFLCFPISLPVGFINLFICITLLFQTFILRCISVHL